jgi:hypothetical protein
MAIGVAVAALQVRDMISTFVRLASSVGSGPSVSISTVSRSTARNDLMVTTRASRPEPGLRIRSRLNTTSAAENSSPSWKRTPSRRWNRHSVSESLSQDFARPGSSDRSAARRTSGS